MRAAVRQDADGGGGSSLSLSLSDAGSGSSGSESSVAGTPPLTTDPAASTTGSGTPTTTDTSEETSSPSTSVPIDSVETSSATETPIPSGSSASSSPISSSGTETATETPTSSGSSSLSATASPTSPTATATATTDSPFSSTGSTLLATPRDTSASTPAATASTTDTDVASSSSGISAENVSTTDTDAVSSSTATSSSESDSTTDSPTDTTDTSTSSPIGMSVVQSGTATSATTDATSTSIASSTDTSSDSSSPTSAGSTSSDGGSSTVSVGQTSASDTSSPTSAATSGASSTPTSSSSDASSSSSSSSSPSSSDSASSTPASSSASTSTAASSSSSSSSDSSTSSTSDSSSTSPPDSSTSPTNSASISKTTSFTEIVETLGDHVTTIFSPVATLNVDTSNASSSGKKDAIIAGSAVGAAALILALLTAVFCIRHRQKRERNRHHRYLPALRSMPLAGEDDFDLAQSRPTRGMMGLFGSFVGNHNERYEDAAARSQNMPPGTPGFGATGEMQQLNDEPPPRLLRPVASKTGSYFQEAVWPPPGEGSRLSDPLMAASHVDLTSIVDNVMGQHPAGEDQDPFNPYSEAGAASSSRASLPPPPSRLRGGHATDDGSGSFYSASPDGARAPGHESMQSMSSLGTVESGSGARLGSAHDRDWSLDSQSGLLAHVDGVGAPALGSVRSGRRLSRDGAPWVPASTHGRPLSGSISTGVGAVSSPLRGPAMSISTPGSGMSAPPSAYPLAGASASASAKTREAAEERLRSRGLSVANPDPEPYAPSSDAGAVAPLPDSPDSSYSSHAFAPPPSLGGKRSLAPSFSVSTSSTQRRRGTGGTGGDELGTPLADESELDPAEHRFLRHVPSEGRLIEVDDEHELEFGVRGQQRVREEIPPRYDMIRRDTLEAQDINASAGSDSRPQSVGTAL